MINGIPQLIMSYSDDGGMTFGHETYMPLIGPDKKYLTRFVYQRQGVTYGRVYRWKCSDDVNITFVSAHADIESGI